jgi:hypothetical protein
MRKAILAFVMVAIVAAAEPAGAIDNGFRGRYRLIARERSGSSCPGDSSYRHPARVLFVSERVRELAHAGRVWGGRFRYVRGERFPWQANGGRYVLRYKRRTDSAVGIKQGVQTDCHYRVRLVPLG